MRVKLAALFLLTGMLVPSFVNAQSADVESTIKSVNSTDLLISLSDGKNYSVPDEFNFDGLEPGVKVTVFYTVINGKRVVDDLVVVE